MLLERETELDSLADAFDGALSAGRVVLIRGEAGAGKSSLVQEFLERHDHQAHVLFGLCDDLSTPQPLGPFWDMVRDGEHALADPLGARDLQGVMNVLLDLLSRSLRRTILVVEDVQWADQATLDVIRYLGRRVESTHGLVILTYRNTEVDQDHPLRGVVGALPPHTVVRLWLAGLSEAAVAELSAGVVDTPTLMNLTGGNPFLVSQMLTSEGGDVPQSVEETVQRQMVGLSAEARQLVEIASVTPGETELDLLEETSGSVDGLAEGEVAGLIEVRDDSVVFRHELLRRAVEGALTPVSARQLNGLVLGWLSAARQDDAARIVHHAKRAGDIDAIVEFAPRAAREAATAGAHREAATHYRALEPHLNLIPDAERALILERWADSEHYLVDYPAALQIQRRALDLYRELGDHRSLVRALLTGVEYAQPVEEGEAHVLLEEALEALQNVDSGPELAQAVNLQAWLEMMSGRLEEASMTAGRAIDLAQSAQAEPTLIHALIIKGGALYQMGEPEGKGILESARARAASEGLLFEEARAGYNLCTRAIRNGDLQLARVVTADLERLADQADLPLYTVPVLALRAELMLAAGEWRTADDLATELLTSESGSASIWAAEGNWVLGTLESRRGRPDATPMLGQLWKKEADSADVAFKCLIAASLAEDLWLTGVSDGPVLLRVDALLRQAISLEHRWAVGRLAFWLWKLGICEKAPEAVPEAYRLMMTGRAGEAAQIWEERGYPYEQALAFAEGDDGDRLVAIELLETLGAGAVAAKLRRELRDRGVPIPRGRAPSTRSHPIGLTARQDEVMSLLAEDLSNGEIADRLFLSSRTVENHVAAVMRKLDVSTRQEAVTVAASQGLLA